jgi:hypothetical protein
MTPALPVWMAVGVVENDREEARSAALAAERTGDGHGPACRCWECDEDRISAEAWR